MESSPSPTTLKLDGALTVPNADAIHARLVAALDRNEAILLDLSDATEIDAAFLQLVNGLSFIRAMRQIQAYKGVPIVLRTTESDAAVKQEAKAAGATGWITKPFKPDLLTTIAKKLLG